MRLRSLLFVPGDSERKFARARTSRADALILDLEDSVAPPQKAAARQIVAKLLDDPSTREWSYFVRVNALDTGLALDDLVAVVKPGLNAIMIPKANGAEDLVRFGARSRCRSSRPRRRRRCSRWARMRLPIRGSPR
jgi:citrate lyase subunit beta / citryl-CoA lyase